MAQVCERKGKSGFDDDKTILPLLLIEKRRKKERRLATTALSQLSNPRLRRHDRHIVMIGGGNRARGITLKALGVELLRMQPGDQDDSAISETSAAIS